MPLQTLKKVVVHHFLSCKKLRSGANRPGKRNQNWDSVIEVTLWVTNFILYIRLFAGSLESANLSILAACRLFKEVVGKKIRILCSLGFLMPMILLIVVGSLNQMLWVTWVYTGVYVGLCGSMQVYAGLCRSFLRGGGEKIRILC